VLPGNPARRVAVIYKDDKAYLFVGAIRNKASLESEDDKFLAVIRSFRPMKKEELALAQPLRLHLIQVKAGQTVSSLARESKLPGSQSDLENRIRLLNNLYPIGEPKPGDWLKVVR
jgi:predicted Zn-dependent protease